MSGGAKTGDRATIVDDDPNVVASLFFLPIFFGASLYSNRNAERKMQIFGGVIVVACLAGSLATLSRSGLLSTGIGLAIISFRMRNQRLILTAVIGALLVLVVKPDLVLTLTNLVRRFAGLLTGEVDASASIRLNLLIASWEMFIDSHLMGVGFRGFGPTYQSTHFISSLAPVYEPHNMTYTVYSELGIIGFLLVNWITFRILNRAFLNLKSNSSDNPMWHAIQLSIFCSLISYFIFYQFIGGAYNNNLFLICCTLPFIMNKVELKNK
jgi:O-antigen ligase